MGCVDVTGKCCKYIHRGAFMQFDQGTHTMAKTEIECETDNERG